MHFRENASSLLKVQFSTPPPLLISLDLILVPQNLLCCMSWSHVLHTGEGLGPACGAMPVTVQHTGDTK